MEYTDEELVNMYINKKIVVDHKEVIKILKYENSVNVVKESEKK